MQLIDVSIKSKITVILAIDKKLIDLSQVRCHIEFYADVTEAVRDRQSLQSLHCIKVLGHVIFTTFKRSVEFLSTESVFQKDVSSA